MEGLADVVLCIGKEAEVPEPPVVHIARILINPTTEGRALIIEMANESAEAYYRMRGWKRHFRLPPPTNPINTTAKYGLEILHCKKWAAYFFEIAQRGGPCHVDNMEHVTGSPLSKTGSSTLAFTWTYDPEITFHSLLI